MRRSGLTRERPRLAARPPTPRRSGQNHRSPSDTGQRYARSSSPFHPWKTRGLTGQAASWSQRSYPEGSMSKLREMGMERSRDAFHEWRRSCGLDAINVHATVQLSDRSLEEKRPEGRSCSHFSGPEGNRTPDLFHAKEATPGRGLSADSVAFVRDPLPGKPRRDSRLQKQFRPVFACRAIPRPSRHPHVVE
jgi:hypothetical protein